MNYSWHNWDEMKEKAYAETDIPDDINSTSAQTLYLAMLHALLVRKSKDAHDLRNKVMELLSDMDAFVEMLSQATDNEIDRGRTYSLLKQHAESSILGSELAQSRDSSPLLTLRGRTFCHAGFR